MDTYNEIRSHIHSTLDDAAADALLSRTSAPELCAALSAILQANDENAIRDACLVIRDCALMASSPRRETFRAELVQNGIINWLEAHLFTNNHHIQMTVVYTLGKICSYESLPVFDKAFVQYRDRDPFLVQGLISESIWLGADEWSLLDRALESPAYATRWSIIERLSGLDGAAFDETAYDPKRLRYLEILKGDENRLVRDEATYCHHVLTTVIPRALPRGERRRRRKALYALVPKVTFMTCGIHFDNNLYQVGRKTYSVEELEEFIDRLAAAD